MLCVGYRGYGHSEGQPSEAGLKLDAKAVTKFVRLNNRIDNERVFLIGRSLGGAVALHLLAELNEPIFKGAIIENTFTGISEMAEVLFPLLGLVRSLKEKMLRIHWDNLKQVKHISCPLLFVSGDKDTFVPTEMT